jgi:hypothetical protein
MNNKPNKTNKGLVILLLLIIIGLAGYIGYEKIDAYMNNTDTKTEVDNVNINLNALYQVGETLTKFDNAFNNINSTYFGYLFKKDKLYAEKFDNNAALYVAMYADLVGTNTEQTINAINVKANFTKIFGNYLTYNPTNISAGEFYNINYNESTDTFSYSFPVVTNTISSEFKINNVKTTLEKDKIIVTRKIFFVDYDNPSDGTSTATATIYTNSNKKTKIGQVNLRNNLVSTSEVLAKYSSKLSTYKYTFVKNSDEDYSFFSVELVK